jgi:hypothetical protein
MATQSGGMVIAVVGDDKRFEPVRQRGVELAAERGTTLILFDVDAGKSLLESPKPTNWSADGEKEQFSGRMTVNDLEALGRGPLADQVRASTEAGVESYGWLPDNADAASLRDYADRQNAAVVLIPEAEKDLAEGLGAQVEIVRTERA